ncbi:MAG: lysylphosphatidylglycerol synthase transmembrane domain-containing protein [Chthoniobacterales bacterium]
MKRSITILIQLLVTGTLLWWIFHNPEKRQMMAEAMKTANWWWMLPVILSIGVTIIFQSWRWDVLLRVQDIRLRFPRVVALNLIGAFFNLFLPGSTGGDVLKIYYAIRESPDKKMPAFLSVVVDRIMGLLALITIAGIISIFSFSLLWGNETTRPLLIALAFICAASVGVILAAVLVEVFNLSRFIPKWLPLRNGVIELASAFSTYARRPGALLSAFILSLPGHMGLFFSFYFAAKAFGAKLAIPEIFAVLPIIQTISSLPISLAGIGVREQLFQVTLSALYELPVGIGALIGFTGFLGLAFWAVLGGLVYIFYRPSSAGALSIEAGFQHPGISSIEKLNDTLEEQSIASEEERERRASEQQPRE